MYEYVPPPPIIDLPAPLIKLDILTTDSTSEKFLIRRYTTSRSSIERCMHDAVGWYRICKQTVCLNIFCKARLILLSDSIIKSDEISKKINHKNIVLKLCTVITKRSTNITKSGINHH